jgi:hypothetical protein
MTTFEEDFPSLKDKALPYKSLDTAYQFNKLELMQYCLDKQKVRDALGRLENNLGKQFDKTETYSPYILMNKLKKELGLYKAQSPEVKKDYD